MGDSLNKVLTGLCKVISLHTGKKWLQSQHESQFNYIYLLHLSITEQTLTGLLK